MTAAKNWSRTAGLVLHALVGVLMLFAGSLKVLGLFPPEEVQRIGLSSWIGVIGAGEVITALLLVVPRTSSLGILLASSFWGGAICLHMAHDEPFVAPAVLLVLSWVGAYLRDPATLGSFSGSSAAAARPAAAPEPVAR
jgi:hypothetical protein